MKITKKQVDSIFENAEYQDDYLIGLYKLVFPKWESIVSIIGFPKCGEKLSLYIWEKVIEFDYEHHSSFPGGLWLNKGFSTALLDDWEISLDGCNVVRTKEV